jgi:hypothetical protein
LVEFGLYPKITTTDSHTSFPRSRSHNGPTNPRNKPQLNPTRKHNSKSKRLRQSGKHQTDRPQCPGGLSVRRARTVREEATDRPKMLPEPPLLHREKWTVRDRPADHPPRHGPSDTLVRTVRKLHAPKTHTDKMDRKRGAQEPARTRKTARLSGTSRTVRGDLADGPPGANQHSRGTRETTSNFQSIDLLNRWTD